MAARQLIGQILKEQGTIHEGMVQEALMQQREKGGRYRVADIVVREPFGIVHASAGRIARKHIRSWQKRITERYGTPPVHVPVDWARHRVSEARKQNATSKQLLPLGLDACAELFEPLPEDAPAHPVADLEDGVEALRDGSAALHQDPEFRGWLPDREALDELLRKMGEKLGPEGAGDSAKVDETMREEIVSATDRFFSPEVREVLADRAQRILRALDEDDACSPTGKRFDPECARTCV